MSTTELKLRKKVQTEIKTSDENNTPNKAANIKQPYKYGPLPKFNGQRIFSRSILIIGVLIYVWYFSSKGGKVTILAKHDTNYQGRGQSVECDENYLKEIQSYKGCIPKKCGRFVTDVLISEHESDILLWLSKRGMSLANSNGGATIMDLHSGALTYGDSFINFYKSDETKFITPTDLEIYKNVREKIQNFIAESFNLDVNSLHLTHPTFFSRLTNKNPSQIHDEYWHVHIDKHTYESFHYTSLLYLNDYSKDFVGGRFIYLDKIESPKKNTTVEPKKGRISAFTSGAENPHFVERVTEGERYAITISFTCDKTKSISDPKIKE